MKMARDPFASLIYVLTSNGVGPQEIDLDMRDRDKVLTHRRVGTAAIRVLHLQDVRDDTVETTRNAVGDFFSELWLADDHKGAIHPERSAHTMLDAYDEVEVLTGLPDDIETTARTDPARNSQSGITLVFCSVMLSFLQPPRV